MGQQLSLMYHVNVLELLATWSLLQVLHPTIHGGSVMAASNNTTEGVYINNQGGGGGGQKNPHPIEDDQTLVSMLR